MASKCQLAASCLTYDPSRLNSHKINGFALNTTELFFPVSSSKLFDLPFTCETEFRNPYLKPLFIFILVVHLHATLVRRTRGPIFIASCNKNLSLLTRLPHFVYASIISDISVTLTFIRRYQTWYACYQANSIIRGDTLWYYEYIWKYFISTACAAYIRIRSWNLKIR
jgi:hypothetical protein